MTARVHSSDKIRLQPDRNLLRQEKEKKVFIAKSILTLKVMQTAVRGELVTRVNCLSDDSVHKSQLIDLKYFCSRYGNFANENVYLPK